MNLIVLLTRYSAIKNGAGDEFKMIFKTNEEELKIFNLNGCDLLILHGYEGRFEDGEKAVKLLEAIDAACHGRNYANRYLIHHDESIWNKISDDLVGKGYFKTTKNYSSVGSKTSDYETKIRPLGPMVRNGSEEAKIEKIEALQAWVIKGNYGGRAEEAMAFHQSFMNESMEEE